MRIAAVPLTGNPDHICSLIAAGIADEYLRRDPETRIRCHVSGGRGAIFVTGEILTQADFDVSHLVSRLLGQYGVYEPMEPFIALEPVESERIGQYRQACQKPMATMGYATRETDEFMPIPVYWANKIAMALEGRRKHDPDWFWLGTSGSVTAMGQGREIDEIILEIDHGEHPLDLVRSALAGELEEQGLRVRLQINTVGGSSSIESRVGNQDAQIFAYGRGLPPLANPAGSDWHTAEVYGSWLARRLALEVLGLNQSRAVMVEALFMPGDLLPSKIMARDEKGRDLSGLANAEKMSEWLADWRKPGLISEAVAHGIVGSHVLPWEKPTLSTLPSGVIV